MIRHEVTLCGWRVFQIQELNNSPHWSWELQFPTDPVARFCITRLMIERICWQTHEVTDGHAADKHATAPTAANFSWGKKKERKKKRRQCNSLACHHCANKGRNPLAFSLTVVAPVFSLALTCRGDNRRGGNSKQKTCISNQASYLCVVHPCY